MSNSYHEVATLASKAKEVAARSLDYFSSDELLTDDQLIEMVYGKPEDQAQHAVATIIALIRVIPETDRVRAFDKACSDIWEGVSR